jgi:hypothetical protein
VDIQELFDGQLHEILPADWEPVSQRVVDWVEVVGREHLELETPDLNWVISDLNDYEQRHYGVADGWSNLATRLQAISRAIGGRPVCYQKGKRYFFQHKSKEEK